MDLLWLAVFAGATALFYFYWRPRRVDKADIARYAESRDLQVLGIRQIFIYVPPIDRWLQLGCFSRVYRLTARDAGGQRRSVDLALDPSGEVAAFIVLKSRALPG